MTSRPILFLVAALAGSQSQSRKALTPTNEYAPPQIAAISDTVAIVPDPESRSLEIFSMETGRHRRTLRPPFVVTTARYDLRRGFWGSGYDSSKEQPLLWSWNPGDEALGQIRLRARQILKTFASDSGDRYLIYTHSATNLGQSPLLILGQWVGPSVREIRNVSTDETRHFNDPHVFGAETIDDPVGRTWLNPDSGLVLVPDLSRLPKIASDHQWLEAHLGQQRWLLVEDQTSEVWYSQDDGKQWTAREKIPQAGESAVLSISHDPFKADHLVVQRHLGGPGNNAIELWETDNGAVTWNRTDLPAGRQGSGRTMEIILGPPVFNERGMWIQTSTLDRLVGNWTRGLVPVATRLPSLAERTLRFERPAMPDRPGQQFRSQGIK
jgi:hypothetical protein